MAAAAAEKAEREGEGGAKRDEESSETAAAAAAARGKATAAMAGVPSYLFCAVAGCRGRMGVHQATGGKVRIFLPPSLP